MFRYRRLSVSEHIADGQEFGYPDVARLVAEAADEMNITDKRVLVIGTEVPWLETILLQRKPRSRATNIHFTKYLLQKGSHC